MRELVMANRLVRSDSNKMMAGVCGGLGVYLGIDPTIVRIAFIVLTLASGIGFALYIVLAIVMPGAASAETPSGKTIERNIEDLGENIVKECQPVGRQPRWPDPGCRLTDCGRCVFLVGQSGNPPQPGLDRFNWVDRGWRLAGLSQSFQVACPDYNVFDAAWIAGPCGFFSAESHLLHSLFDRSILRTRQDKPAM